MRAVVLLLLCTGLLAPSLTWADGVVRRISTKGTPHFYTGEPPSCDADDDLIEWADHTTKTFAQCGVAPNTVTMDPETGFLADPSVLPYPQPVSGTPPAGSCTSYQHTFLDESVTDRLRDLGCPAGPGSNAVSAEQGSIYQVCDTVGPNCRTVPPGQEAVLRVMSGTIGGSLPVIEYTPGGSLPAPGISGQALETRGVGPAPVWANKIHGQLYFSIVTAGGLTCSAGAGTTGYMAVESTSVGTTEGVRTYASANTGRATRMDVYSTSAVPAGQTLALTLRVGQADTDTTCTITAGNSVCAYTGTGTPPTVPVAGQVTMKHVCAGGTTAMNTVRVTVRLESP